MFKLALTDALPQVGKETAGKVVKSLIWAFKIFYFLIQ